MPKSFSHEIGLLVGLYECDFQIMNKFDRVLR